MALQLYTRQEHTRVCTPAGRAHHCPMTIQPIAAAQSQSQSPRSAQPQSQSEHCRRHSARNRTRPVSRTGSGPVPMPSPGDHGVAVRRPTALLRCGSSRHGPRSPLHVFNGATETPLLRLAFWHLTTPHGRRHWSHRAEQSIRGSPGHQLPPAALSSRVATGLR